MHYSYGNFLLKLQILATTSPSTNFKSSSSIALFLWQLFVKAADFSNNQPILNQVVVAAEAAAVTAAAVVVVIFSIGKAFLALIQDFLLLLQKLAIFITLWLCRLLSPKLI